MVRKDASAGASVLGSARGVRARWAIYGCALTLAICSGGLLGTASPAGAEVGSYCQWSQCSGAGAGTPWQIVMGANGGSWYSRPGLWAIHDHRGSFTIFWWNFFARYSRAQCQGFEEPVSESGALTGPGWGTTTVNEGGEGNQPIFCEVVAE